MKDGFVKVAAASLPLRVADCAYNAQPCIQAIHKAADQAVRILVFPELCLTGYTCQDLFSQEALRREARAMEAQLRQWRNANGRLCQYLAGQADQVTRVFCGLEQRLK